MLRQLAGLIAVGLFSLSAQAQVGPIEKLQEALAQQAQNANGFAGTSATCLTPMAFTKSGPTVLSGRQCIAGFASKAVIESLVATSGLSYVYRNKYMDIIQIPNGSNIAGSVITAAKGSIYYLVQYDDAGNASEATAFNDALP